MTSSRALRRIEASTSSCGGRKETADLNGMATIVPTQRRQWTKAEYYQMADLGWFRDQRVELIAGEVLEMSPQRGPHAQAVGLAHYAIDRAFGPGFWVRVQLPLDLGAATEPEPDLAVVEGGPRDYPRHPRTALLLVEASDTSLDYDSLVKGEMYARAGIEDYWILDLVNRQVRVYRRPTTNGYAQMKIHEPGDAISPLASPSAQIAVDDLLP